MSWGRDVINPRLDVLTDLGYRYFDWHVDPSDWRSSTSAAEISKEVLEQTVAQTAQGREHIIILLHDRYKRTLDALPGIITSLREKGYEFDIIRNFPG
jgi:peptidoglycan/xylan/chitin deacetylase (PgdA/CDA1 family)